MSDNSLALGLISLGLGFTLLSNYFPEKQQAKIIDTCQQVITIGATVLSVRSTTKKE